MDSLSRLLSQKSQEGDSEVSGQCYGMSCEEVVRGDLFKTTFGIFDQKPKRIARHNLKVCLVLCLTYWRTKTVSLNRVTYDNPEDLINFAWYLCIVKIRFDVGFSRKLRFQFFHSFWSSYSAFLLFIYFMFNYLVGNWFLIL